MFKEALGAAQAGRAAEDLDPPHEQHRPLLPTQDLTRHNGHHDDGLVVVMVIPTMDFRR
jgi:hypothetical protein